MAKLIIVGESEVGKSKLFDRLNQTLYNDEYRRTIGVDCSFKPPMLDLPGTSYVVYDLAGSKDFRALVKTYYFDAEVAMLCFDRSNEASFRRIQDDIAEIKEKAKKSCQYILVETKSDLNSGGGVSEEQINQFKKDNEILFHVQTSAKKDTGFTELTVAVRDATQNIIDYGKRHSIAPGLQNPESTNRINWSFLLNAFIGLASVALCVAALATMSIVATPVTVALAVGGGVALLITVGMFAARQSGPDENPDPENNLSIP